MFREMRRNNQLLSLAECEEILRRNTSGVLAVCGDEGYPYTVPLSYVYLDGALYFHCANEGHKLDAIRGCDKVSFCVIDKDDIVGEEYTTYFRSVVAFGRARVMEGEEKFKPLVALCEKYYPGHLDHTEPKAAGALSRTCLVEISVEHMTGKEAVELTRGKT